MKDYEVTIHQLVEWVESASPVVWKAAYRQALIDGIEYSIITTVLILSGLFVASYMRRDWHAMEEGRAFCTLLLLALWGFAIGTLIGAIDNLASPTFQAIKYIVSLWPHK